MSTQVTVQGLKALDEVKLLLGQTVEDAVKDRLISMAQTAVSLSPVDTGAYVTSHSFKSNSSSRGRGKSSDSKPRGQNPQAKRQEGLDNLISDINSLDLSADKKFTLRNDSPHAAAVEHGEFWPRANGYFVYTQIRNIYG